MNAAARRDYWLLSGLAAAISIGALMVIKDQSANRKCGGNCREQKIVTARRGER